MVINVYINRLLIINASAQKFSNYFPLVSGSSTNLGTKKKSGLTGLKKNPCRHLPARIIILLFKII